MTREGGTYALKFLDGDRSPAQGFVWPLPKASKPGKWVKAEGGLRVCRNGIHAVKLNEGAMEWLRSDCYIIELGGEVVYSEAERKYVARKGRLVRKVEFGDRELRLFAADCAAHVLKFYEAKHPDDKRPRKAIAAARRYARKPTEANRQQMHAARDAAWAAARDAAGAAARVAAWAAAGDAAGDAARDAAWAAAGDAARDAARAAARAAARDAETRWQVRRLARYIDAPEVESDD